MARSRSGDTYFGRAGEMAVMSELLLRGWNVAVPQIDVGQDVFVIRDDTGNYSNVQVKAATATQLKRDQYSCQVCIRYKRLATGPTPDPIFIFTIRQPWNSRWVDFVTVRRALLYDYHETKSVGTKSKDGSNVTFSFTLKKNGKLMSAGEDMTGHLNDWAHWPVITH